MYNGDLVVGRIVQGHKKKPTKKQNKKTKQKTDWPENEAFEVDNVNGGEGVD